MTTRRIYHHSLIERLVYGCGGILTSTAAAVAWLILPPEFILLKLCLTTILGGMGLLFAVHFLMALERISLGRLALRLGGLGSTSTIRLKAIRQIRHDPASGRLQLVTEGRVITIRRWISHFDALIHDLKTVLPDHLWLMPSDQVRLTVTGAVAIVQVILLGISGFFWWLMMDFVRADKHPILFVIVVVLMASLLAYQVLRLVFLTPRSYHLSSQQLEIHFWLRRRRLDTHSVRQYIEDTYAAAGASFFLIKLVFPRQTVILDENFLKQSLKDLRPWIKAHYSPSEANSSA